MRECQLYLPLLSLCIVDNLTNSFTGLGEFRGFFYQEYTLQLANYFSVENNIQVTSLVEGAGSSCFRKLIEPRECAEKKSIYNINKCF